MRRNVHQRQRKMAQHAKARCGKTCVEVEEVVSVLIPVVSGVAQAFHDLLVELRVAEVEEGDRQEEG